MEPREALRQQQQRWMAERQAELDRTDALASLGLPSTPSSSLDARLLERLTEQITTRLTAQVRKESAKALQSGEVGGEIARFLEGHIATNTCPICYELMSGKEHQPMLLFPCGHTFCAGCLQQHLKQKAAAATCPFCRTAIGSHAINVSLQQVIDGFVEKQRRLERGDDVLGEVAAAGAGGAFAGRQSSSSLGEAERYAQQYRAFTLRCTVLTNQLEEAEEEARSTRERTATASLVLEHLKGEEEAAADRLRQAQVELDVAREQRREQETKLDGLRAREVELQKQAKVIQQTLGPLQTEREKARLLVKGHSAQLAAQLDS